MNEAVVQVDGIVYRGDGTARTVTPTDRVSLTVLGLLETGALVGPQIDEFAGVIGDWDQYPKSMIAAFMDVADHDGLTVTWFSDRGTEPPTAATEG